MESIDHESVRLTGGLLFEKEELNRTVTLDAVYRQFEESGRIRAFDCAWRVGEPNQPHFFWDSDVAKWMEGAAYSLAKHPNESLERRIDDIVEKIRTHQGPDGYFNIYFTAVDPSRRFSNRDMHELYCAGHLIEAAIACDKIGKPTLLSCMKKYIAYIRRVFVEEKSAAFCTPGHEEPELALLRLYRHTGEKEYLTLAAHFIDLRGTVKEEADPLYALHNQSHLPVREQTEAVGHAVRALYLYTAMAMLAKETKDDALLRAAQTLFNDIVTKKMYVTGGVGSTPIGESFTNAYDLPNDIAYAETCASIGMMLFSRSLSENTPTGIYADTAERAFYNGVLSGLSADGTRFFYENPLEINLNERFTNRFGSPRLPITRRPEIFGCSCCPPNINRIFASLGGFLFGKEEDTLYIHQYASAELSDGGIRCNTETDYPIGGVIRIRAEGVKKLALRIPAWCTAFTLNRPYEMKNGYALLANDGDPVLLTLDLSVRAVYASPRVARDAYSLCIMRGPVVYCAEAIDNEAPLSRYAVSPDLQCREIFVREGALPELAIRARVIEDNEALYSSVPPREKEAVLRLIPYHTFANRAETDMRVWFHAAGK